MKFQYWNTSDFIDITSAAQKLGVLLAQRSFLLHSVCVSADVKTLKNLYAITNSGKYIFSVCEKLFFRSVTFSCAERTCIHTDMYAYMRASRSNDRSGFSGKGDIANMRERGRQRRARRCITLYGPAGADFNVKSSLVSRTGT